MANEIQSHLRIGLDQLKNKGAVSINLVGTALSFSAMISPIENAEQASDDWTPSDDEECHVYIDKAELSQKSTTIARGRHFQDPATGVFYEVTETKTKGPALTSRFRCRLYREG